MFKREYTLFDKLIMHVEQAREAIFFAPDIIRASPADIISEKILSEEERKLSANLLRVDHAGEVCAQALYLGQSFVARNLEIKKQLVEAAKEEGDHLAWCAQRLKELDDRVSYLNPVWYVGSYAIGLASGLLGDQWNLGFLAETERQVEQHLETHLQLLPKEDKKSHAILLKMKEDEIEHAHYAVEAGGRALPNVIKQGMTLFSKMLTTVSFYF